MDGWAESQALVRELDVEFHELVEREGNLREVNTMLAQFARAAVRRHLARASAPQLLSRSFAQTAEQVVDTSPTIKVFILLRLVSRGVSGDILCDYENTVDCLPNTQPTF